MAHDPSEGMSPKEEDALEEIWNDDEANMTHPATIVHRVRTYRIQRPRMARYGIAFSILATTLLLLAAQTKKSSGRPVWPKQLGEYIATSSEGIPLFPKTLSGYRSEPDKDFWGKPFTSRGQIRVFPDDDWKGLDDFPNTMNGCANGVFMIRWRSSDPTARVQSSSRNSSTSGGATIKTGAFGYMSGTNCEQPMFKLAGTNNGLVDVFYELKFWQAAP